MAGTASLTAEAGSVVMAPAADRMRAPGSSRTWPDAAESVRGGAGRHRSGPARRAPRDFRVARRIGLIIFSAIETCSSHSQRRAGQEQAVCHGRRLQSHLTLQYGGGDRPRGGRRQSMDGRRLLSPRVTPPNPSISSLRCWTQATWAPGSGNLAVTQQC